MDWAQPAEVLDRQIRGRSPFPGAWCDVNGERVKLLGSKLAEGNGQAGRVLNGFTIACGKGEVEITRLQREGKKPVSTEDALRGMTLPEHI